MDKLFSVLGRILLVFSFFIWFTIGIKCIYLNPYIGTVALAICMGMSTWFGSIFERIKNNLTKVDE
jgi:hypothetical protein